MRTLELICELVLPKSDIARYFQDFIIPGKLGTDDRWLDLSLLHPGREGCTCDDVQLQGLGASCSACNSKFAANRIAEQYAQHCELRDEHDTS